MRVIPVVVLDDSAAAAPLADAGLPCAEITLRTAAGEAAISIMAQRRNLLVGAGTVLDAGQVEHAVEAGARRRPGRHRGGTGQAADWNRRTRCSAWAMWAKVDREV